MSPQRRREIGWAVLPWQVVGYYERHIGCRYCRLLARHTWELHDCTLIWAGLA